MMSYPLEKEKGRAFTVFWVIFQMGTLIGAAIALGIEAPLDVARCLDRCLFGVHDYHAYRHIHVLAHPSSS